MTNNSEDRQRVSIGIIQRGFSPQETLLQLEQCYRVFRFFNLTELTTDFTVDMVSRSIFYIHTKTHSRWHP